MAVRITTYDGDGDDLAALITRVWRGNFAGKSWFPLWESDYVRWRILDPRILDRELIVCAYDGDRLVGCVIAEATDARIGTETIRSALVSYLSVDPDAPGRGIALRMLRELETRLRARGLVVAFGVVNDRPGSPSKRFWDGVKRQRPDGLTFLATYRSWVAVCRPRAVARAGFSWFDRIAPWGSSLIPWGWMGLRGAAARAYTPGDLVSSLALVQRAGSRADVATLWTAPRLSAQLDHPQAHCLVRDGPNGLRGVIAGYLITWVGAQGRAVRVGFVELCVGDAVGLCAELLIALGRRLAAAGADMVVMMDAGVAPRIALLLAGFIPIDPHVRAMALFDTGADLRHARRLNWPFT